jgi:hypothetical protein
VESIRHLLTRNEAKRMEARIMTKLSELAGKLEAQNTKLTQIALDVKALKDAQPPDADPELPATADTQLTNIVSKVAEIENILHPTPPQP